MDLVGGVCVPDNQFTVLRCGYQVSPVGGPVHSIDLGQVSL